MSQLNLSARAYHRTQSVKLARTVADLAGCEEIQSVHLAKALHGPQSPEADIKLAVPHSGYIPGPLFIWWSFAFPY
jgi:hypothetical protein